MKEHRLNPNDESSMTEISILPDGRVYLFGASREVLELLHAIPLGDPALAERIECLRLAEVRRFPAADIGQNETCSAQHKETVETPNEDAPP